MHKIPFPRPSIFKIGSKHESPYVQFYKWIGTQDLDLPLSSLLLGPRDNIEKNQWGLPQGWTFSVSHVCLHNEDYKALKARTRLWVKRQMSYASDDYIDKNLAFHDLDIGPKNHDKYEKGYIILEDGFIAKEKDRG